MRNDACVSGTGLERPHARPNPRRPGRPRLVPSRNPPYRDVHFHNRGDQMILVHVQDIVKEAPPDAPLPDVTAIPCEFMGNHENGHASPVSKSVSIRQAEVPSTIGRGGHVRNKGGQLAATSVPVSRPDRQRTPGPTGRPGLRTAAGSAPASQATIGTGPWSSRRRRAASSRPTPGARRA